uniref:C2H2-type domain-containing protein n=1 Tax=viral metagenome TaxID=1070528 RepID=A0A6C0F6E7_9ZZZZ
MELAKVAQKFCCEKCDYSCSRKNDFSKHCLTSKHLKVTDLETQLTANSQIEEFQCKSCNKLYKSRTGLWKHNKTCIEPKKIYNEIQLEVSNIDSKVDKIMTAIDKKDDLIIKQDNLIVKLLDQNTLLQNQVIELCKEKNTVINNTINTTNNNNFNIQFFLNEQCKDAVNLIDFINSLQLQLHDLETTGKLGYVEGISRIFINGLKQLETHKRPIHCSDAKREIFYVKDKDTWERENKEKNHLKKAIKMITHKNFKQLPEWEKKNPDCFDSNSKKNDEYNLLINRSTGSSTEEQDEKNYNKIIKNVAKEVVIEKV